VREFVERGQGKRPIVVGVASGNAAGKTTILRAILERIGSERVAHIWQDGSYRDLGHLSPDERAASNYCHPNALEDALLPEHLRRLAGGQAVDVPTYGFRLRQTLRAEPRPVIVLEGILVFAARALRKMMGMRIYVDADADVRLIRRLMRDVKEGGRTMDSVPEQYLRTVRPMRREFVEPSKRYADVIVPEGGQNVVALDM